MNNLFYNKVFRNRGLGILATIVVAIGLIILCLGLSFLIFNLFYWLGTLILATFFGVVIPFSWWYGLGAWLLYLMISFLVNGIKVNYSE